MKLIWNWIKNNPNRTMFLVPILLVAGISISHVVAWYDIANPMNWAIYLSIAIEVGAMTALVAATNKIKGGVWFMFGLVTLIQMIGNIFYSFKEIDENGELFKSWVELTAPFWDLFSDSTDVSAMKRWLAFLEGGLLPIISLTSLHFFVKYEGKKDDDVEIIDEPKEKEEHLSDEIINDKNIEQLTDLQEEADRVWEKVNQLREEGKLPQYTEPDTVEEPTALAFTPYIDEEIKEDEELQQNELQLEEPIIEESQDTIPTESDTVEEEPQKQPENNTVEIPNLGENLSKTWRNILKNRNNNNISRI